ncbi:MAG: hypothetical protein FIB06_03010 [Betaproteobacteria bacterium]|nr:hypothetical protein [Betaproteobacteria bacterium]
MNQSRLTLLAAVALLAGCAGGHAAKAAGATDEARTAALAAADWKHAENVTIELRDYGFQPRELTLKRGQAYRLRIHNTGGNTHYLNAPDFFASIAAHKVEVPNMAEIRAEHFTQFEIMRRGGELEFEFVPLVAGRYRAHCHLEGHAERGVEGLLIVE